MPLNYFAVKAIQTLVQYGRENLSPTHSHHQQLEKTVVQRLKWAAGANPTLTLTLQQFEDSVADTGIALDVSAVLLNRANVFMHLDENGLRVTALLFSRALYLNV